MAGPSKIEMMFVRPAFQMPFTAGSTFTTGPQDFIGTAFGLNDRLTGLFRVSLHGIFTPLMFMLITMEGT
jgi:hypothetical protein